MVYLPARARELRLAHAVLVSGDLLLLDRGPTAIMTPFTVGSRVRLLLSSVTITPAYFSQTRRLRNLTYTGCYVCLMNAMLVWPCFR
jgi:hypothetical protein